jgi:thiol-disulfide isomerase/thioredoxin
MIFRSIVLGCAAALALMACSGPTPAPNVESATAAAKADPRPKAYALIGQPMPAFRAALSAGGSLTEADLKGKWTIIDFWGIWCPDCMRDSPHVAALYSAVQQDPDLRMVSVHVDRRTGRWADVQSYVTEKQIGYPVMLDPERDLYKKFQLGWAPTYLVVDPAGIVRGFRTDLSQESDPAGGVKTFLRDIAALKSQTPATP